jgi:uncharacterized protein YoxC
MALAAHARQPEKGLTFEDVWAMFQETDKKFQETDKKFQESRAEHDRIIAETDKKFQESRAEHDRIIAETNKAIKEMSARVDRVTQNVDKMSARVDRVTQNVGGLNRSIGELIETLIAARLWEKFASYPYQLQRAYQRVPIYDEQNKQRTDIDILLSDTEWCMAVEVKREADDKDVDHHLRRMELVRRYPPLEVADKRLLGAIAGGVVSPDTVEYAHKAGLFVLTLTGESVVLLDTPAGFAAREW